MMESSNEEWQKTKDYLISQLFDNKPISSPVPEEKNTEDTLSRNSSFQNYDSDGQNRDNVAAENVENSSDTLSRNSSFRNYDSDGQNRDNVAADNDGNSSDTLSRNRSFQNYDSDGQNRDNVAADNVENSSDTLSRNSSFQNYDSDGQNRDNVAADNIENSSDTLSRNSSFQNYDSDGQNRDNVAADSDGNSLDTLSRNSSFQNYDSDGQNRDNVAADNVENSSDTLSRNSSFQNYDSDGQNRDNVAADNDGNSSESSASTYPDLIIEREPNRHDEPEEYYQELKVRMRKAYQRMFYGICDEQSSKGDTPNNEIADKTGDVDTTERLCSYEPTTNEQIQDKPDDNVIMISSIQRDANSTPVLSKLGRSDSSTSHDTHELETRFEANDDRAPLENTTDRNFVHSRVVQSSESSSTSKEPYARRGQSHVGHLEDTCELTSTPTHFDMEVGEKLDLNDNDSENKRKTEDTRAVKRKSSQTSFRRSHKKAKYRGMYE